jgi:hypothetical protein
VEINKKTIAMKKPLYNTIVLATAILVLGTSTISSQEVVKDYSKSFPVSSGKTVTLSNRYGDVTIETWDRNEVTVDVKVTVEMSSKDRSEKVLSLIQIEFLESDTEVGAKTILDEKFSSATRGVGSNRFRIDYIVKMPKLSDLSVANRYGNIKMGEHPGLVNVDLRYGNLNALKLTRGNTKPISYISISYGKAYIDEVNWASVTLRYVTDMTIGKAQAMTLDSRYSKITIDDAGSIVTDSKYDNINVGSVQNLVSECAYTGIKIGTLYKSLTLNAKYGSFNATTVPAGFESLFIDAAYCGVGLGISESAKYKLEARVTYASLSYCEECIELQRKIVENNSREIAGVAGSDKNPAATVTIKSSYGSVRLK